MTARTPIRKPRRRGRCCRRHAYGSIVEEEREGAEAAPRLRRVLPVAHELADGTWLTSVELWVDHLVVLWAKPETGTRASRYIEYADDYAPAEPPRWWGEPQSSPSPAWQLSDDTGTPYGPGGPSASGNESGVRGEMQFAPAPPPEATWLRVRNEMLHQEVIVSLSN